ncbi:uncharacterized protein CMU_007890 [Cryptosporidium muris RN66]|uniref:Uncharacterized protein n=1 Tax=Cryptosporidium muris (strain RN66) TaxID=441375 RepID=B6ADK7_CRYMR|nr:uncharacterized protein CMU_007890 [Cryptosporidium muris RN66]EEA06298.1 hypothetical protein, conserved [Cryptosporidium muris RN66]|eukprot:XP_002140647.1 hypothetical protein [Cryptosporidium muris RN66]
MSFRGASLLPKRIFIFSVPWLLYSYKVYCTSWITDNNIKDLVSEPFRINNAQFKKYLQSDVKEELDDETFEVIKPRPTSSLDKYEINSLYDSLAQQVRVIVSSCPSVVFLKNEICKKYNNGNKNDGVANFFYHDKLCDEYSPSLTAYSHSSTEPSYTDSGDVLVTMENEDIIIDNPNCGIVVVDGDVTICGDLTVANGQLNVLTSFDANQVFEMSSSHKHPKHTLKQCIIRKGLTIRGSLIVPFSNLYIIGNVSVGKNIYGMDIQIDLSSTVYTGLLYLYSTIYELEKNNTNWDPFVLTPMLLQLQSQFCPSKFLKELIDNIGVKLNNSTLPELETPSSKGSIWSGSKLFVGNRGRLWARGDIIAGEISIADGGFVYGTCGNLKTNVTDGLGIHIRDSGKLHMLNASVETSRLSIVRSSKMNILKGSIWVEKVLVLHTGSSLSVSDKLKFSFGLARDSSTVFAGSILVNYFEEQTILNNTFYNSSDLIRSNYNKVVSNIGNKTNSILGYFQILATSSIHISNELIVHGSLEISQASEVLVQGKISIDNNSIISESSSLFIQGNSDKVRLDYPNFELTKDIHENLVHRINGSMLVTNSSKLAILNGGLLVNEYLDIINGELYISNGSLTVKESVIASKRGTLKISLGNIVIGSLKSENQTPNEKLPSFFVSDSQVLVGGSIVIYNGNVDVNTRGYLQVECRLIVSSGNLGISLSSAIWIKGINNSKSLIFTNEGLVSPQNSKFGNFTIVVNGNVTLNSSNLYIGNGNVSVDSLILTTNSQFTVIQSQDTAELGNFKDEQEYSIFINVLLLQGYSNLQLLKKNYKLLVELGVMIDEFSILYCDYMQIKGDIFVDDGAIFSGKLLELVGYSTIACQDSARVYLQQINVHFDEVTAYNLIKEVNGTKVLPKKTIFVAENGASIYIHRSSYSCRYNDCIKRLHGIRTRESTLYIGESKPWNIPIKLFVQHLDSKNQLESDVVDPIAFVARRNATYTNNIQQDKQIIKNKGEQIRSGRVWNRNQNTKGVEFKPIQWQ